MSKATADLVAQQLGQIATAVPADEVLTVGPKRKFKSRFFFTLDEPEAERREKFKPKELQHVDAEIVARTKLYKNESSSGLKLQIEKIREYFLTEIAPLTMAASSGAQQAQQVIERFLDGKVDTTLLSNFDTMMVRAAKLKLSLFVLELFHLDQSYLPDLNPQPQGDSAEKRLNAALDQILDQLKKQDAGLNILTNQLRKTRSAPTDNRRANAEEKVQEPRKAS